MRHRRSAMACHMTSDGTDMAPDGTRMASDGTRMASNGSRMASDGIRVASHAIRMAGYAALMLTLAIAAPAAAQGPGEYKRALLEHHLPLTVGPAAAPDARRRADSVGIFDLIEVGIVLDFGPAVELPDSITFDVTFEAQQQIRDGFPLLAAFYTPLSIRELRGAELEFAHNPQSGELAVFLPRPIPAGETRTYVIEAALDIACDTPPGCSNELFLHLAEAAWYPMSLEFPTEDRFRVRLELSTPRGLVPTGTGVRLAPQATVNGRVEANFITEEPTILPAFSVGEYAIDGAGIVEVFSPWNGALPQSTAFLLDVGRDSIELYGALFGRYPFGRLGMAAIDSSAGAGIGPQANILLPDAFWQLPPEEPAFAAVVREVTSHEIGHQYFFNLLGVVDNGEAWMSEAFAEYAATRMSEAVTGTRDHARRNYWAYVHGVSPAEDRPLWGDGVSLHPRYFELVYQKGSAALHALRFRVGSDRWDAAFRGWVNGFAGQLVTTDEFERHLLDALGADLTGFFDQYIYGSGVAELRVRTTRGRTERAPVTVQIEQPMGRARAFEGPLPLRLHAPDGSARDVTVPLQAEPFELDLDGAQWIEVDPDLTFFRTVRSDPAGDVNLDGVVDGMDLLDLQAANGRRFVREGPTGADYEPDWAERFDLDDDGAVDAGDVDLLIQQFGAGW